jgi:hypothetical protein
MANWLQKFTARNLPGPKKTNLPARTRQGQMIVSPSRAPAGGLPNASIIYGVAAAALFGIALCFLLSGKWFTGFLVMLPAACFLGFSLHFLKNG